MSAELPLIFKPRNLICVFQCCSAFGKITAGANVNAIKRRNYVVTCNIAPFLEQRKGER